MFSKNRIQYKTLFQQINENYITTQITNFRTIKMFTNMLLTRKIINNYQYIILYYANYLGSLVLILFGIK